MSDEVLISVENVSKKFCRSLKKSLWYGIKDLASEAVGESSNHDHLRKDEFWAVDDVSFELRRGECLGLIGRNGAGKTTLLKMLNGLIKPDKGKIEMRGRVGALIALGAGFNPILTGRENIYVNGSVLGLTKKEIDAKLDEIIDFADIHEFIDSPVQSYSSGMAVRLGFAVAAHCEPDILLVDEVLAVGDISFKKKCFMKLAELKDKAIPWILVSHDMGTIMNQTDRVVFLSGGKIEYMGSANEAISNYMYLTSQKVIDKSNEIVANSKKTYNTSDGQINRVFLLDENSKEKSIFKTGEPLIIQIDYSAGKKIRQPSFGIAIYGHDNMFLTGTNTKLSNYNIEYVEGDGSIYFRIPRLSLYSGVYRVRVDFHDNYMGTIDMASTACYLQVKGGQSGGGVFLLDHSWNIKNDQNSINKS